MSIFVSEDRNNALTLKMAYPEISILIYSLVLWLGLYLIGRNLTSPRLWLAGLGLVTYALSLATGTLLRFAPTADTALILARLHWPTLFLPAILWFGAVVYVLPETIPLRNFLNRILSYTLLPVAIPFYLFSAGTNLIFDFSTVPPQPGPAYLLFAALALLPLLAALILVSRAFQLRQQKKLLGLLLLVTLFFALSAGLLIFPLGLVSRFWLLLAVSIDFISLGVVIALLDAFEEGETLLPDFIRSLDFSASIVLIFGGLVALTMMFSTGVTFPMLVLLLAIIAATILLQTFLLPIQALFDNITFKAFPRLRQERANLRAVADALPRADTSTNPATFNEDEFNRLTRRALSHMGNLPRLATSPLTRLPVIDTRLVERQATDNTLERAAELKSLLTESITRLKPRDKGDFGTTEEWRHYNALYYPYVVGLKPYSRRNEANNLDPAAREVMDWFRTYVPERTLYNWQNAAATLVANDLREGFNAH
ncbi:MAG: hypothetical protein GY796_35380 [Chloroflexi bacterium]|nr:hypothetical protein [Chloroflexota bacterium]